MIKKGIVLYRVDEPHEHVSTSMNELTKKNWTKKKIRQE